MSARVIQVRSSRNPRWQKQGGWEVFEAEGVSPVYCGESGRKSALSYARQRAAYGRAEIQVLDVRGRLSRRSATKRCGHWCKELSVQNTADDSVRYISVSTNVPVPFSGRPFPKRGINSIRGNFNHCVLMITASAV